MGGKDGHSPHWSAFGLSFRISKSRIIWGRYKRRNVTLTTTKHEKRAFRFLVYIAPATTSSASGFLPTKNNVNTSPSYFPSDFGSRLFTTLILKIYSVVRATIILQAKSRNSDLICFLLLCIIFQARLFSLNILLLA